MQLSAEELRNDFAFVGGDIKRVERYRKMSRAGAPTAPPHHPVTIPHLDQAVATSVSPPPGRPGGEEAKRTGVDAHADAGDELGATFAPTRHGFDG